MSVINNSIFFFSSIRQHTMWTGDWSSDVCSSDLESALTTAIGCRRASATAVALARRRSRGAEARLPASFELLRSEERRVGKECRYGWTAGRKTKTDYR